MFVSKVLGFFAIPSNLVMALGLAGVLLLATRFVRAGRRLIVASIIVLAILGYSPIGNLLIIPLEQRFPPWDAARGAPDGIVVLGGAISPDVSTARNDVALNEAAERMTAMVELARRYPNARIVFSGGSPALFFSEAPEAEFAVRLLQSLGIPRERILVEEQSRNTVENAVFSQADRATEAGRALAAGDIGLSYAPVDGRLPRGRFRGRALSGRLAHPRPCGCDAAIPDAGGGAAAHGHRGARMGWPGGLLADGTLVGTVSAPN